MGMVVALHPYQEDAYDLFMERGNALLAFEMGTGKTVIAIAVCEELLASRKVKTCLLVVPSGLKYQWAKSIAKFTDCGKRVVTMKGSKVVLPDFETCVIIDGTPAQKEKQYQTAYDLKPEYVIIGVDQVSIESDKIAGLHATMAVLDEASSIKTPSSNRSKAVKWNLSYPYRLALTGTPIENKPEDVFSIMEWVDKSVLGKAYLFDKSYIIRDKFGAVQAYRNLDVLYERLSQAMCRKTWSDPDVAAYLPRQEYETWRLPSDPATMDVYKLMAADLLKEFDSSPASAPKKFSVAAYYSGSGGKDIGIMGKLMPVHTCMEMLLDYPPLILDSQEKYLSEGDEGSAYAHKYMTSHGVLPSSTPKKDFTVKKINQILSDDPDSKVLVFTRYRGMVDILARDFKGLGYGVTDYHGEMTNRQKEGSVTRFLEDPECRVFVSSHAGAYGVDMPVANWLINYDIPWSNGTARQINGRHVRASSEHEVVHIVNVVTHGTIEERMLEVQSFKSDIADAAVDGKTVKGNLVNDVQALRMHCRGVLGLT